jgi:formylglycine-generating enzyme required for sulfatase activity
MATASSQEPVTLELRFIPPEHADGPARTYTVEAELSSSRGRSQPGSATIVFDQRVFAERSTDDDYGRLLSEKLFVQSLRSSWGKATGAAQASEQPIHLILAFGKNDSWIHGFRWETLLDPDNDDRLSTQERRLTLSRFVGSHELRNLKRPTPLKALVAIASPQEKLKRLGLPAIDVVRERDSVLRALGDQTIQTVLPNQKTSEASFEQLRETLRNEKPDILYLLCHGKFELDTGPYLLLDGPAHASNWSSDWLKGSRLRELFTGIYCPALVILMACQSAGTGVDLAAQVALAPMLASAGVPAVIGMQGKISTEAAARFTRTLLEQLMRTGRIDQATAAARAAIADNADGTHCWAYPVLYLGSRNGQLYEPTPAAATQTSPQPPPPTTRPLPKNPDALERDARRASQGGEWARAVAAFEQLHSLRPTEANQTALDQARRQQANAAAYDAIADLRRDQQWAEVLRALNDLQRAGRYDDPEGHRAWASKRQRRERRIDAAVQAAEQNHWRVVVEILTPLVAPGDHTSEEAKLLDRGRNMLERAEAESPAQLIAEQQYPRALTLLETHLRQEPEDLASRLTASDLIENHAHPLDVRLRAAELVGLHGDTRDGVCNFDDLWASKGFPAGLYTIASGDERVELRLDAFQIARYPVTVWQFKQFVAAGGYTQSQRHHWTEEGWKWRERNNVVGPYRRGLPEATNLPISGVSWYEAAAFCAWLTERGLREKWLARDQLVRLPTEAEWEVAACWDLHARPATDSKEPERAPGAPQPWPLSEDHTLLHNSDKTGLDRPVAVGLFPAGASPCGARDMAGNVWEWCASPFDSYPFVADELLHNPPADSPGPALRGGSFVEPVRLATWYARRQGYPVNRPLDFGLRLCLSAIRPPPTDRLREGLERIEEQVTIHRNDEALATLAPLGRELKYNIGQEELFTADQTDTLPVGEDIEAGKIAYLNVREQTQARRQHTTALERHQQLRSIIDRLNQWCNEWLATSFDDILRTGDVQRAAEMSQFWFQARAQISSENLSAARETIRQLLALNPRHERAKQLENQIKNQDVFLLQYNELSELVEAENWEHVIERYEALKKPEYDPADLRLWASETNTGDHYTPLSSVSALRGLYDPQGYVAWAHQQQTFDAEFRLAEERSLEEADKRLKALHRVSRLAKQQITNKLADQIRRLQRKLLEREAEFAQNQDDLMRAIRIYHTMMNLSLSKERERKTVEALQRAIKLRDQQNIVHANQRQEGRTLRISWCESFKRANYDLSPMQSGSVSLDAFTISCFPVTIWQYEQFINDKAYTSEQYWTPQGWLSMRDVNKPYRWEEQRDKGLNHPIAGISWYEAAAFCKWLTYRHQAWGWIELGDVIRLPTDAEWSVAALLDVRTGEYRTVSALQHEVWQNSGDAQLGSTSPVGAYPYNKSPCGALDMSGNVWEWCASEKDDIYHQEILQRSVIRDDFVSGESDINAEPVLRGGSYLERGGNASFSARTSASADDTDMSLDRGFRLCLAKAPGA